MNRGRQSAQAMIASGITVTSTAHSLGVDRTTLHRHLAAADVVGSPS